jgi:hypothetical protein
MRNNIEDGSKRNEAANKRLRRMFCPGRAKHPVRRDVRAIMKRRTTIVIGGVLLLLIGGAVLLFYMTFGDMIGQMRAGKRYMNSLSSADRTEWIDRTIALLSAHPVTNDLDVFWIYSPDVPMDLKKLRIERVDVLKDRVRYVWVGGLDHTLLSIERTPEGSFRFYAQYNDEYGRELWPEKPIANKGLEGTGDPRTVRQSPQP